MQTFFHLHIWDGLPMGDSHFQFRGPFCVVENQATQTGYLVQRVYTKKNHLFVHISTIWLLFERLLEDDKWLRISNNKIIVIHEVVVVAECKFLRSFQTAVQ